MNYASDLKTNRMQLVADQIDSLFVQPSTGSHTAGSLVIFDGSGVTLATLPLNATCGTVSAGILTVTCPISAVSVATGSPASAEIRNNAGSPVISALTVGTSGAQINITKTPIHIGGLVTVTSGSITHG